jgi:hypothetical protein
MLKSVIEGSLLNQLLLKVCNLPRKLPLYILIFLSFTDDDDTIEVDALSRALSLWTQTIPALPFSLRSSIRTTYCTVEEAENRTFFDSDNDNDDITTDTGNNTEDLVDSDDKEEFDPDNNDVDLQDMNMVWFRGS